MTQGRNWNHVKEGFFTKVLLLLKDAIVVLYKKLSLLQHLVVVCYWLKL